MCWATKDKRDVHETLVVQQLITYDLSEDGVTEIDTDLVSPNGGALGAGERDVHETLVVQQLAEDSQQVALMIVPP